MQKRRINKLALMFAIVLSSVLAVVSLVLMFTVQNANAKEEVVNVSTFDDLYTKTLQGCEQIRITGDIELTGTIYIPGETTIYVNDSHVLTRSKSFTGELFVIGEDDKGNNSAVKGQVANLKMVANGSSTLTIDGNSDEVDSPVKGSAFFIVNGAKFEMNNNVIIKNCKKTGNEKSLNYRVSYPERIGGAAIVVTSGSFLMNGGEIKNCEANLDESTSKEATYGGAIFNFGTVYMHGGKISNCKSARGGAIYNYKMTKLFGGELSGNYAEVYGGAIYNPNSQYSNLFIGKESESISVNIKNNISKGSGGAIFSSFKAAILVKGSTLFEGNQSLESNGGAINSPGSNVIKNAIFKNNSSASKGGALYAYYNSEEKGTLRHNILTNVTFDGNISSKGGAVGCYSSIDDMPGAKIIANNCKFINNKAVATSKDSSAQGGALYSTSDSIIDLNNCQMNNNEAEKMGGGIYITGASILKIENITANENNAPKGGFLYHTTTGTTVKIVSGSALNNTADEGCGSTIWTNSAKVVLQIKGTTTKQYFNYNGEILGKGAVVEYEE